MTRSPTTLAELLARAHATGDLLLSGSMPELGGTGVAWRVQREGQRLRLASGAILAGWKLGYTSAAMRQEMGIAEPNYGPLYADMLLASGSVVGRGLVQPRAEPEIAFVLATEVRPEDVVGRSEHARLAALEAAVAHTHCALEVVDSAWASYAFTWQENTADGSSAARVILGDAVPPGVDVAEIRVRAGEVGPGGPHPAYEGRGSAAMGHPLLALGWLVDHLAEADHRLCAGDVVLSGGLTPTLPLRPGSTVRACFDSPGWSGRVEVIG